MIPLLRPIGKGLPRLTCEPQLALALHDHESVHVCTCVSQQPSLARDIDISNIFIIVFEFGDIQLY